jgi:hypothetical protein
MTDQEFDAAVQYYRGKFRDLTGRDGAIYIVTPEQVVNGGFVVESDEAVDVTIDEVVHTVSGFVPEFRRRMDGNQTPVEGTVVAVLG